MRAEIKGEYKMRRIPILLSAVLLMLVLSAAVFAGSGGQAADGTRTGTEASEEVNGPMLRMKINDTPVMVEWEDNASVAALKELAAGGLTIRMSMYGGFEQVGPIGQRLPSEDVHTVTASGDIVLYSGDQLVVFYGSNSWAYTRLGHIADKTPEEMRELLGNGGVTVSLTVSD